MKNVLTKIFLICFGTPLMLFAAAPSASPTHVIALISRSPKVEVEAKILPFFKARWASCPSCEIKNLSPYNEKGELDRDQIPGVLGRLQIPLLYWDFNEISQTADRPLIEALQKLKTQNIVIVGPGGFPLGEAPSQPLSRTLLGQVPETLIIGELGDNEGLAHKSFYGPEMLTALKPQSGLPGPGWEAGVFAAELTQDWDQKKSGEWVFYLRSRKVKSPKIWPQLNYFLPTRK